MQPAGAAIAAIVVLLLARDFIGTSGQGNSNFDFSKKLDRATMVDVDGGRSLGGRVHVAYCSSWSYKGAFMQVAQLLERQYPGMRVVGSSYPVAPLKAALSKALGFAQMAALAVIFFGDKILPALGIHQPPDIYRKIIENKFGWAMGVWFVGNMLHNSLTSTGAFEIYYDGHLVFSKIQEGRMPGTADILASISQLMQAAAAKQ